MLEARKMFSNQSCDAKALQAQDICKMFKVMGLILIGAQLVIWLANRRLSYGVFGWST